MTRQETVKILSILQAAYPMFYRNQTQEQIKGSANLWYEMFKDRDYVTVSVAVKALIATRSETFPPTIGAVNEMIIKTTAPQMTAMEAWGYVSKALRNGIYGAYDEWNALPELIKQVVSPEQIRTWAMDNDFNESVMSSNFMRSFEKRQQNQKEIDMLPNDTKHLVEITLKKINTPRLTQSNDGMETA